MRSAFVSEVQRQAHDKARCAKTRAGGNEAATPCDETPPVRMLGRAGQQSKPGVAARRGGPIKL
jgi:hypothetical protein